MNSKVWIIIVSNLERMFEKKRWFYLLNKNISYLQYYQGLYTKQWVHSKSLANSEETFICLSNKISKLDGYPNLIVLDFEL